MQNDDGQRAKCGVSKSGEAVVVVCTFEERSRSASNGFLAFDIRHSRRRRVSFIPDTSGSTLRFDIHYSASCLGVLSRRSLKV